MPNEMRLQIRIGADGSAAITGISQVGAATQKLSAGSASVFEHLKSHWLAVTGAVYGAVRATEKAYAMAKGAAGVQEQMASLDALAARYGTTGSRIVEKISEVSGGLIGMGAAVDVAAQSMAKNLKPDQMYALAEAAETLSNVTGKTAADSFRELSAAVALGKERALEGSAGAIDLRDRYGELAQMMSEAERRQAMFNEILARAAELKRQGVGVDDSAADKLERFENAVADASRQVGGFLVTGIVPLTQGMTAAIGAAQRHADAIKAAAVVAGVYAASQFLAASAAVGKLAFAVQNAGYMIEYFATITLGPMLANPLTWIAVAVGALAYLWIKLGRSTEEAKRALDDYRVSVAALSRQQQEEELRKQEKYIADLSAWIDGQKAKLEGGPPLNIFRAAADANQLDEQIRLLEAAKEKILAIRKQMSATSAPGGGDGGDGHSERLKKIAELERGYADQKRMSEAAEDEREKVRLNNWYADQVKALDDLKATQESYDLLYAAYSATWDAAELERKRKLGEQEVKDYEEKLKKKQDLDQAIAAAALNAEESRIRSTQAIRALALQAGNSTQTEEIRGRYDLERQLIEIQRQRNFLKLEERSIEGEFIGTEAELVAILSEEAVLQEQIAASRLREANEISYRRLELEREITDLTRQQAEMRRESAIKGVRESFDKLGGGAIGASFEEIERLRGGMSDITTGTDPYSIEFQRWSALQDQKIMAMEEQGASEASLRDAYREYDLRQEEAAQQQKVSMAGAGFGMMANLADAFYQASGSKNRKMFELAKAMRIGEAAISTYTGVARALADFPWPYSLVVAAAVAAQGVMQIRSIAAQKPGTGAAISVGGGGTPALSSSGSAPSASGPSKEGAKPSPVINVHLYNSGYIGADADALARDMAVRIAKAWDDGVR